MLSGAAAPSRDSLSYGGTAVAIKTEVHSTAARTMDIMAEVEGQYGRDVLMQRTVGLRLYRGGIAI